MSFNKDSANEQVDVETNTNLGQQFESDKQLLTIEMENINEKTANDQQENDNLISETEQSLSVVMSSMQENQQQTKTEGKQHKTPYKRVELCLADKVKVINASATGQSQRQLAKQFGISKTQVQCLLKRKEEILHCYKEGLASWRKRTKGRKNTFKEVGDIVWNWYKNETETNDQLITGPMIQAKAMAVTKQLGLHDEFQASNDWLEGFRRNYGLFRKKKPNEGLDAQKATMVNINSDSRKTLDEENCNGGFSMDQAIMHEETNENQLQARDVYSIQCCPSVLAVQPTTVFTQYGASPYKACSLPFKSQHNSPMNNQPIRPEAKLKIRTYDEALRFTSALKDFAVDKGSVTLIGLMTAMEHELQRENKICVPDTNSPAYDINN